MKGLNCISGVCVCEDDKFYNNSLCGIVEKNEFFFT